MLIDLGNVWSRLVQASEPERQFVQSYLSFDNAKARYAGQPTFCLLHPISGVFMSGFVPLIQKNAVKEGFTVSLIDRRVAPCKPDLTADLSWLRDYQRAAVDRIVERQRGIVSHPTGGGKSEVITGLMRVLPCRWLFMVHRTTLVEQTADRFELRAQEHKTGDAKVGRIGEGRWSVGERATFATFQTLYEGFSRKDPETLALLKNAEAIAVDECFPARTRVGNTTIEKIRVGDLVPAYDTDRQTFVCRRVLQRFVRRPSRLVRLALANGEVIVCTPGHPFFVSGSWVPAYCMRGFYVLRSRYAQDQDQNSPVSMPPLRNDRAQNDHQEAEQHHVRGVLQDRVGGAWFEKTNCTGSQLRGVRQRIALHGALSNGPSACREHALLQRMPFDYAIPHLGCDCDQERWNALCANESAQSHVGSGDQRESSNDSQSARGLGASRAWWQRTWTDGVREHSVQRAWVPVGDQFRSAYEHGQTKSWWVPDLLQDRSGARSFDGSGRGRRGFAQSARTQGAGSEEGYAADQVRVDRVEVLERGREGTFGDLCPDDLVYNLEVEGTQTYLVGSGLVVHNCHVLPSSTHLKIVLATTNAVYRCGLSGTPLARGDRRSIYAIGALGPIVHEVKTVDLQAKGVLAKAEIRFVPCYQTHGSRSYSTVYRDLVSRSDRRNALLVSLCQRAEKPALVFVREIDHGRALESLLWRAGIRAAFVYGDHSTDWRQAACRRLKSGDLDVLVATTIFREGIDLPFLRSVVLGSGGESQIELLQGLGRGMRIERNAAGEVTKSSFGAWDILDQGQRWLERHAEARKAACLEQGFSTIVES